MSTGDERGFESRLDELRDEATRTGRIDAPGVHAGSGPMPPKPDAKPGYYGRPVLEPPVWTWEIPVYFFVGGLAGASAVIAWSAGLLGADLGLVRAALWISLCGAAASAVLLIMDLGRPARFLYMLRVFKWRSPMSVGVWLLTAFGGFVTLAVIGVELTRLGPDPHPVGRALLVLGSWAAAPLGALVATYTGVLIGATVVPAWNLHRGTLPLHFGIAALGSGAAALELLGFDSPALWALGALAAGAETLVGLSLELSRHGAGDRALRRGRAGLLLRSSAVLAGPVSLVLRLTGASAWAAAAFLVGALANRFGWLSAGAASASDPEAALKRYA